MDENNLNEYQNKLKEDLEKDLVNLQEKVKKQQEITEFYKSRSSFSKEYSKKL